ncbi:fumarylacetoacetate hydrolase family protein [Corynebacterium sp. 320]|uniref:fumarylacetoacetate hydrolase family protein n=1 Tax=Corynebacterium TaxID=1716 RepID=UPI00125CD202|nr:MULTISPECIES: fumarylacetoacetate hydrolase family protein [Corynebacterium]KAB1503035.1 fumarylacetoacetate hydrolase family protein [Corynebacterium sp. 320]KAB1550756.1 fumarylacetoacetate hydrolase family protein [Corynebacterium sp. 321]KAB1551113.1 fumarylacetoacetate hydrolase family protein [Corynebacterium sp. 319]KAB3526832.1 fumarylacetoacetate hydrolase family protein [Corynebacterium sp. 250]KAB3538325.1 fumarylacetoacetate hydrolase family protein [Corynebacterium sp. 366]
MKIASIHIPGSPSDVTVPVAVESFVDGHGRGHLIPDLWTFAGGHVPEADLSAYPTVEFTAAELRPVIPNPGKIICVGLNFREHIEEMGHPIPDHPTLFAKFADSITGPYEEVMVPEHLMDAADYEGELAVVIGDFGEIAGYAIMNDFSQRDWQYRTQQWLQGKNLFASSGFGPWMVTPDECDPVERGSMLRTWINGELRQEHSMADLVFKPTELVEYIQQFTPLNRGDVIVCGTPAGVAHGMSTPRYLTDGDEMRIAIEGIGEISNRVKVIPAEL